MPETYCVILTTTGSQDEANHLARLLVSRKLAACVQCLPMTSFYIWKEAVQNEAEVLLLIKTCAHLYAQVQAAIVENHGYEIPEVIQLPIVQGLPGYLGWIGANTLPEI